MVNRYCDTQPFPSRSATCTFAAYTCPSGKRQSRLRATVVVPLGILAMAACLALSGKASHQLGLMYVFPRCSNARRVAASPIAALLWDANELTNDAAAPSSASVQPKTAMLRPFRTL